MYYADTFIIKQIPTVGSCICPECRGIIEFELRRFYNIEKKYNFVYYGYKNYIYKIDKKGNFTISSNI